MNLRKLKPEDQKEVLEIFPLYWNDPVFIKELSDELSLYINGPSPKINRFFVAEIDGEIVGIAGFKKTPDYLIDFAKTDNPVELYIIAMKYKRKGIGTELKSKLIEEIKNNGFSEILLYSPNTHQESWNFHDTLGFDRVGEVTPPEDEAGHVWRKIL